MYLSQAAMSREVLEDMPSWLDAANIDLKSFSHDYYKKVLKTDLDGVLDSLIAFAKSPIWLEITTLLIPDVNDSSAEIEKMAEFIVTKLGKDVPWHFSAFHPDYKMLDTPSTSMATLSRAKEIAKSFGIKYVYLGNVRNDSSTYCPKCQIKLVDREGYEAQILHIKESKCTNCSEYIAGVWE